MKKSGTPQWYRVLCYLKEFGSITPLDALRDLGIFRLGARIFDLRERGYMVTTEMVEVKNRWGEFTRIAKYRLEED